MRYEQYGQYTSKWHKVDLRKENKVKQQDILRWCHEHGSTGRFHCVYNYFEAYDKATKRNWLDGKLVELRLSKITDFMEFVLIGDFYEQ